LICFFVSVIDVLRDLKNESFIEAIEFVPATLIVTFLFTLSVHKVRNWILKMSFIKSFLIKKNYKWMTYTFVILIKAIISTFIIRIIAKSYSPEYTSYALTGLFFWASFVAIVSIILMVYVIEAFLESELEKKEFSLKLTEIENERVVAKYQALKNQLNPHFLFNSFNSLSALIAIDVIKADAFLQELSNVYRYNLDHSEELVVSLKKELKLIKSYMALQNIRFRESITINYTIDNKKNDFLLPPMTLELLVENAIKHNRVEKTNPLKISIETHGNYVIVENGFQPRGTAVNKDSSLGIGLKNLKNQYELIHTEVPIFKIENGKYIARIPLITPNI
jgi:sensor histidine kinase YesM